MWADSPGESTMMTKKTFVAVAAQVKSDRAKAQREGDELLAISAANAANIFADLAQKENPRFDRDRFLRACGLK